ncbi:MAG: tRNA-(ms[2]io[6]A)-hydroxylase [Sorangiineae bacterium]|nr:tRNA-(ms[2]io[6]A)-hydroxylase [Polyangiaceae bacterium]MEB2322879.1 tRNA-(ms[2]io[6]A)-hydroxylase [Sorangiineae bacterium]
MTPHLHGPRFADSLLLSATSPEWASVAASQLDATLADHAHCEKKAAVSALALINDYPEDARLVRALGHVAEEEIAHFREVHARLLERGATLDRDRGDPYARALLALVRRDNRARKLDRLLVCALIEARSCERFGLLRGELELRGEAALARWYQRLESAEAGHAALFVHLASDEHGETETTTRVGELAREEARIVAELPLAPRIH